MKPDQPSPSEPFPRETIPPELLEWARQTFDEEEFLAQVREIEATGDCSPPPTPYRVEYSERVRQRGDGEEFIPVI